jgi:hypothetical protein
MRNKESFHMPLIGSLWPVLLLLGLSGCFPGYVRLTLLSDANTNEGRPLRVLVRSVSEEQQRTESHASVSALVVSPDATVLRSVIIDPGTNRTRILWIKHDKEKSLGLYFLYTTPAASWKMLVPPLLPWRMLIPLGRAGVRPGEVRECRRLL